MPSPAATASAEARWAQVYARLLLTEGGYVDATGDRGGATNFGLSLRFLAAQCALNPALKAQLDADNNGRIDAFDIRALTAAEAEAEYRSYFWSRPGFDALPPPFDGALFDQGVNGGCQAAVKLLQGALNTVWRSLYPLTPPQGLLAIDGKLGSATSARLVAVCDQHRAGAALVAFRACAADRYRSICKADPAQAKFLKGWLRRAGELGCV